jgi:hypothetical protein
MSYCLRGLILASLFLPASVVVAEEHTGESDSVFSVEIESDSEVLSAYGLVLLEPAADRIPSSSGEVVKFAPRLRRRDASVKQIGAHTWIARVQIREGDAEPRAKVTAVGITVDGRSVAGKVQWINPPYRPLRSNEVRCRSNEAAKRLGALRGLSKDALDRLIELRTRRAGLLKAMLGKITTPTVMKRLNEIEKAHNLQQARPLSAETSLEEFVARIGALHAFAKNSSAAENE